MQIAALKSEEQGAVAALLSQRWEVVWEKVQYFPSCAVTLWVYTELTQRGSWQKVWVRATVCDLCKCRGLSLFLWNINFRILFQDDNIKYIWARWLYPTPTTSRPFIVITFKVLDWQKPCNWKLKWHEAFKQGAQQRLSLKPDVLLDKTSTRGNKYSLCSRGWMHKKVCRYTTKKKCVCICLSLCIQINCCIGIIPFYHSVTLDLQTDPPQKISPLYCNMFFSST